MRNSKRILLIVSALLCAAWAPAAAAASTGLVVDYSETDPGSGEYRTRMIVTRDYLRFDEGDDSSNDFLLFDRRKRAIYNANALDKTILVIESHEVKLPEKKDWQHSVDTDNEKVPPIDGKAVKHWVVLTNNLVCYDLYAAKDLMPDATAALGEYSRVLAAQQADIYLSTTGVDRDPCDLANNIYLPDRHLQFGFPVRQSNKEGRSKKMLGYRTGVSLDDRLFQLPAGYREYRISDIRH